MQICLLRIGEVVLLGMFLSACGSRVSNDCIRLTPSSRQCARSGYAAEPPPPAPIPVLSSASGEWTLTVPEHLLPFDPSLLETVWNAARPPFGEYDFVALRRITAAKREPEEKSRPVFFFIPGAHAHGEIIIPDERYDLRVYLARRGIETWTLDYRTHFLPREQIMDSNFMQVWTAEAFIDDVIAATQQVQVMSGRQHIFLGGFGVGASFAALAAARSGREDIGGLVLLDGYVLDPPDAAPLYSWRTPTPNWFADDLESRYMPYKRWMKILQDIIDDPNGPDFLPVPLFANRAQALAHFLYVNANFGARGGLSNAQNGRADISVLARVLQHQDRYWPRVQNHGGFSLADHLKGTQFDYAVLFRAMRVPILAFTSDRMDDGGLAWSERMEFSAHATSTTDVSFQVLKGWGHFDVLWGSASSTAVFTPITHWLLQHEKLNPGGT